MQKIDELSESLVHCTKLSLGQHKKLINWFNKQNIIIKIDIFDEQKNQYFKLKNKKGVTDVTPLAAFYLAADKFYVLDKNKTKNKTYILQKNSKLLNFSINQSKKSKRKVKKEKLLNLYSIILKLKNEGFSYRQISKYLLGKHRFKVSHTYIQKILKELEDVRE